MAALLPADVTTVKTWYEWVQPFVLRKCAELILNITSAGVLTTDTIDAATLGFKSIDEVSTAVNAASTIVMPVGVSYDKTKLLFPGANSGTATAHVTPTAITGVFRLVVKGTAA